MADNSIRLVTRNVGIVLQVYDGSCWSDTRIGALELSDSHLLRTRQAIGRRLLNEVMFKCVADQLSE